jgi:hypothetical protein
MKHTLQQLYSMLSGDESEFDIAIKYGDSADQYRRFTLDGFSLTTYEDGKAVLTFDVNELVNDSTI